MVKNQRGASKITLLVFGAIFSAAIYSSYKIIPFYYSYYELLNQMRSLATVEDMSEEAMRTKLEYHIKRLNIPASSEDVYLSKVGERVNMSLRYTEVFYIEVMDKEYDLMVFEFNPSI